MNRLFLTTAILLVTVVNISLGDDPHCCAYPIRPHISTNITTQKFTCSEPIAIVCQATGIGLQAVGIAGQKRGSEYEMERLQLATDRLHLEKAVICGPSTVFWHMEGSTAEYDRFTCAYKKSDGTWFYD